MSTEKYKVGDTLYRVPYGLVPADTITIDQVGRKWLHVGREQIDPKTLISSIKGYGAVAQCYPDKAAYEALLENRKAWLRLRKVVSNRFSTPAHLTTEQITSIIQMIEKGAAP